MLCQFCGRNEGKIIEHLPKNQKACICSVCINNAFICGSCKTVGINGIYHAQAGNMYCAACATGICHYCGAGGVELRDNACPSCHATLKPCNSCGKLHKTLEKSPIGDVCMTCVKQNEFYFCSHCETWHTRKNYLTTKNACKTCAADMKQCYHCGNLVFTSMLQEIYPGKFICKRHLTHGYCDCCGESAELVNYTFPSHSQAADAHIHLCGTCLFEEKFGTIKRYHYKPAGKFKPTFVEGLAYFGVENEVNFEEGTVAKLRVCKELQKQDPEEDYYYMKKDASVYHGFEIVTHPFTFEYFKESFPLNNIFNVSEKYIHSDQCGMHVHISKDAFSNAQLFKFMQFLEQNQDFATIIAERHPNDYCSAVEKDGMIRKAIEKSGGDRGQVNLQPEHTVEVRMFQGAITKEQFSKNVEFTHALYKFCKVSSITNLTVQKFVEFVHKEPVYYNNLITFLKQKGYII